MEIFLVDTENVGFNEIESRKSGDMVFYFTSSQAKVPDSKDLKENDFVISYMHDGCKDALDFIIDTYLGFLIAKYGKDDVTYNVISKDKGFLNVCGFWMDRGYHVSCTAITQKRLTSYSFKGYKLVKDMTYTETKKCMNIYRSVYLNCNFKDDKKLIKSLYNCFSNYGYSMKEVKQIASYLCDM